MQCPHCDMELLRGKLAILIAHHCFRCGGLWLDNETGKRLLTGLSGKALTTLADQASRRTASPAHDPTRPSPETLSCPVCSEALRRQRFESAWLDLDLCDAHGTWFDLGEVEKVALAVGRPVPRDWRSKKTKTAPAGPKAQPVQRTTLDDMEIPDARSPYLRGFGNILRSLWATATEGDYCTEADVDIEVFGKRVTLHFDADGADAEMDL